jgi:hypothetical protein
LDDLNALLGQIMSDPEAVAQIKSLGASLGLGAAEQGPAPMPTPVHPPAQTPDLSSLASLVGLLGSRPAPQAASPPGIDVGTIMKLTQAMASVQANRQNIDLLLALKPRLKPERARKVDDAIRVMQLIQFLPLIKESGLFGEMDQILGGLAGRR